MKFDKFDNIEVPEKKKSTESSSGIYNISIVLWSFDK